MHPAYSVILFTTSSGAGYGLLFWLSLAHVIGAQPVAGWGFFAGLFIALGLITLGLLSSTFHLGRPERAWRALSQWRSSWLSREGLAAIATYVPAGLFAIGWVFFGEARGVWGVFGLLASLGAAVTVACTGMIYASLPTIRQWHHPMVVPVYLILSLYTGALWLVLLAGTMGRGDDSEAGVFLSLAIIAGLLAAGLKLAYWRSIDGATAKTTSGTATGLGGFGRVRLLEAPSTSRNYVMREMGYRVARKHATKLRAIAGILGVLIPLALLPLAAWGSGEWVAIPLFLAALSGSAGVVVERWLFFAEATHVVTTYYGTEAA